MPDTKYFLDQDHDGHWYLIPAIFRREWASWLDLPEAREEAWDAPNFACRLDGGPSHVEFRLS